MANCSGRRWISRSSRARAGPRLKVSEQDPSSAPQAHVCPVPTDGQIALGDFLVRIAMESAGKRINQEFSLDFEVRIFHDGGVPGRGLEPLRIAPPDPKSGASANFATLAAEPAAVATIGHRRTLSRAVLPAIAESVEAANGRGLPIRNYPADSV